MRSLTIRFFILLSFVFPSVASAVTPMVSAGLNHSISLKSDGTLAVWGNNYFGQLGDGTTTDRLTPKALTGLSNVTAVAAGLYHSVALKSDGTVIAWGNNYYGQLGDGTATNRLTPVAVPGLTQVIAVAAGFYHSVAVKSDGTVVAWGNNYYGQLGDGTTTNRLKPVAVSNLTNVAKVAAGLYHSVAVKSDGGVATWGDNYYGQLGDGTTTARLKPVEILHGLAKVVSVSIGCNHTVALEDDGAMAAWGDNSYGQLGDGTMTQRNTPIAVPFFEKVSAVMAGCVHTVALKTNGTVAAWGNNYYGQLGDGTTTNRLSPVKVRELSEIKTLAAGQYHNVTTQSDGTSAGWGINYYGQLGDGTTTSRLSPMRAAAPPGVWTTKTPMLYQRDNAANAVLDGKIYVFGGAPAGVSVLSSMEVYDPATDTWPLNNPTTNTPWPPMSIPRYGPAAVGINGVVYVIGGTSIVNGQNPIYKIAVYDPKTNTWSYTVPGTSKPLADFPTGRWGFDVTVVNGLIYTVGGAVHVPGNLSKADWSSSEKITGATSGTPITGLYNDSTYYFFVKAVDASGNESGASFEVAASPRESYAAGTIPDGLDASAGNGQATLNWSPVTGASSYNVYYGTKSGVTTSDPLKVTGLSTTSATVNPLTNGTAYYFIVTAMTAAGETAASNEISVTPQTTPATSAPSNVKITGGDNQVTLSWNPVPNAASYNVYYTTGINLYYGNVEVYDPVANTWTTKSPMPTPRWGSTVVTVNGLIYAIGGWGGWPELSVVEVYDPATDKWSAKVPVTPATTAAGTANMPLTPMPTARDDTGFAVLNGIIYVIGGDTGTFDNEARTPCCTTVVEAYDPVLNTWSTKTPMPTIRDDFDSSMVNGVIYSIAGSRDGMFTEPPALDPAWLQANNGGFSLTLVEAFSTSSIPVPREVRATSAGSQVSLNWQAVADATSYNIYWSNKAGVSTTANSTMITSDNSTAYNHTGLTPGKWYYYVVTAETASGESLPSNEVAIKL